jgi:hypothetical protein
MAAGVAVRTRLRVLGAGNGGGKMTTASPDSGRPRRLIASYETYYEAQRAVDALSDSGFPVETVTIVGSDLRLVERVTGRLTIWRAALAGAVTGAWFGFLIGLVFWIVSPWALGAVLAGVLLGLVFGAFWGAVAQALTGGTRDFASVRGLEAARYDVLAEEPQAEAALRLMSQHSALSGDGATPAAAAAPRYEDRR